MSVIGFETEDEAVTIANDSDYGLSGGIYTTDLSRAFRVAHAMRTGSVGVNGYSVMPNSPAGGIKRSGMGREGVYHHRSVHRTQDCDAQSRCMTRP